jgi:hypothetical protein
MNAHLSWRVLSVAKISYFSAVPDFLDPKEVNHIETLSGNKAVWKHMMRAVGKQRILSLLNWHLDKGSEGRAFAWQVRFNEEVDA